MQEEKEKSKSLQTVERALDVLYLFHEYNGITLSFVAEKLDMSTTVAYRLLYTLAASGFLKQEKGSKKYFLGEKALILGYKAIQSQDMKTLALPMMQRLKEICKQSILLTVCADMKSLCLEKLEAENELQLAMKAGGLYPLHKGASNRPLLAFMEEKKRDAYIDSQELTGEEKERLRREMGEVRWRGYDDTQGLLTPGHFSIGFPLYGMGNKMIGCLSVGGCCFDLKDEQKYMYRIELAKAAAELSRLLGAEDY